MPCCWLAAMVADRRVHAIAQIVPAMYDFAHNDSEHTGKLSDREGPSPISNK